MPFVEFAKSIVEEPTNKHEPLGESCTFAPCMHFPSVLLLFPVFYFIVASLLSQDREGVFMFLVLKDKKLSEELCPCDVLF